MLYKEYRFGKFSVELTKQWWSAWWTVYLTPAISYVSNVHFKEHSEMCTIQRIIKIEFLTYVLRFTYYVSEWENVK